MASGRVLTHKDAPSYEQLRALVLHAPCVVAVLEADLTVRFVSPSVLGALGFSPEEVVGSNLREYLSEREAEGVFYGPSGRVGRGHSRRPEVELRGRDGALRRFEVSVFDRLRDPDLEGIAVYLHDVTERSLQAELLAHRALHDPLTGLPNRTLLLDRLARALGAARREGRPIALLFLDLDDFKSVNDSFGHEAGDRLLAALGRRVRSCLRPGDTLARLGGDEFAVLIEEGAWEAGRVAERVEVAMREPLELEGRHVSVSASVGLTRSSDVDGEIVGPEQLLRAADAAMYGVKKGKKAHRASESGRDAADRSGPDEAEDEPSHATGHEELDLRHRAATTPETRRVACIEAPPGPGDTEPAPRPVPRPPQQTAGDVGRVGKARERFQDESGSARRR